MIKASLLTNHCCVCGLKNEWNGKKLSLQLDHIDGNRTNNELKNLRIICPNCHTQTDNYAGKGKRRGSPIGRRRITQNDDSVGSTPSHGTDGQDVFGTVGNRQTTQT